MFSNRIHWDLEANALTRLLARKRAAGETIWDLSESNPTRVELVYPFEDILASLCLPECGLYQPEPMGLHSARTSVAEYYRERGRAASPDDIVLTSSTSEGYSYLFKLLCNAGDEVMVPRPSYPLFDYLASLEAVGPVPYSLAFDGEWRIDPDSLEKALSSRTRAIIAVHPNNPTGSYLSPEDRERLLSFTKRNGLALIVDEVFIDYPSSRSIPAPSLVGEDEGLLFVLSGLSKLAALPQLKLAWIVACGPEKEKGQALERLEHISDTYLSVGTPVQLAAPHLLRIAPDMTRQIRERIGANLDWLGDRTRGVEAISLLPIEGGWYQTLRLPAILSSEQWALAILDEASVLVHPGDFFGFPTGAYLVLSLLAPPAIFREGFERVLRVFGDRVDSADGR